MKRLTERRRPLFDYVGAVFLTIFLLVIALPIQVAAEGAVCTLALAALLMVCRAVWLGVWDAGGVQIPTSKTRAKVSISLVAIVAILLLYVSAKSLIEKLS